MSNVQLNIINITIITPTGIVYTRIYIIILYLLDTKINITHITLCKCNGN